MKCLENCLEFKHKLMEGDYEYENKCSVMKGWKTKGGEWDMK